VDLVILPVGGGPTIDAAQAKAIADRLRPAWVVPMRYRTPRVGLLDTADESLELFSDVQRLTDASFDTAELPDRATPSMIVPAAP